MPINKIATSSIELQYENYINILRTNQSVTDTGWSTYSDSASINPVDGIGGTASITWSQNTSSPLSGDADLRLVKDASNRQGNGVSIPFTIANRHLAKTLQISFDMELVSGTYLNPILVPVSGTYSITSTTCTVTATHSFIAGQSVYLTFTSGSPPANGYYTITSVTSTTFVFTVSSGSSTGNCTYSTIGDLRISIIQDPTGTPVVLEPANTNIQLGIANQRIRHIATFQTHVSLTSYRLCIHVGTGSTLAYTVDFANIRVWEQQQSIGSVITDWQSYTPTVQGMTFSSSSFLWRRVGGSVEIFGSFTFSSSTVSVVFQLSLPSGLSINSSVTSKTMVGKLQLAKSVADANNPISFLIGIGGNSYLTLSPQSANYNSRLTDFNSASLGASSGDIITVQASVPIAGWGSSVAMSSDTGDGRVVALYAQGSLTSSISGDGIITWTSLTTNQDTHGAFNFSTGIYTAPISGYYNISGHFNTNASINTVVRAWVNGVSKIGNLGVLHSANGLINISGGVFLNAGEQLTLRPNQAYSSVASGSFLFINRISAGSQVIATQETVSASYHLGANQTTSTQINFGTLVYDTHGAVTTGVGAWKFTAPMNGKYLITGFMAATSGSVHISLYKNNSIFVGTLAYLVSGSAVTSISGVINLLAGEYIDLRPNASVTIVGGTLATTNTGSIQITRIGN